MWIMHVLDCGTKVQHTYMVGGDFDGMIKEIYGYNEDDISRNEKS